MVNSTFSFLPELKQSDFRQDGLHRQESLRFNPGGN
jgi:hypothetical protein